MRACGHSGSEPASERVRCCPDNSSGTPTPKCGTCGCVGGNGILMSPGRLPCPDCRSTPTGRTPAPEPWSSAGRCQLVGCCEPVRAGRWYCERHDTPNAIGPNAPTPGSTTGVDEARDKWCATECARLATLRTELAEAREANYRNGLAWRAEFEAAKRDLAAALKREGEAMAERDGWAAAGVRIEGMLKNAEAERDTALKREGEARKELEATALALDVANNTANGSIAMNATLAAERDTAQRDGREARERATKLEEGMKEIARTNGLLCRHCGDFVIGCDRDADPEKCPGKIARALAPVPTAEAVREVK